MARVKVPRQDWKRWCLCGAEHSGEGHGEATPAQAAQARARAEARGDALARADPGARLARRERRERATRLLEEALLDLAAIRRDVHGLVAAQALARLAGVRVLDALALLRQL